MKNNIRNFILSQRIEYRWRRVMRLRKKAAIYFETDGEISSPDFRRLYRRLDRHAGRVMALEEEYARLNSIDVTRYREVAAVTR